MIDAHVHIWNLNRVEYEWLHGDTTILHNNYSIDDLEAERKAAGITKAVLIQAANTIEETNFLLETAIEKDWVKGVVGWLPLQDAEQTERVISSQYMHQPYIKGVRHLIHNEANTKWLVQPAVQESLELLATYGLTYDVVGVLNDHLTCAIEIAGKIPSLNMVLDHMHHPPIGNNNGNWFSLMKEAARHQNIYVKISGLGSCIAGNEKFTAETIRPYIEFVLEIFGTERCFCGGDWPVALLSSSYTQTWNMYRTVLSSLLNTGDLQKVYQQNAERFYKL